GQVPVDFQGLPGEAGPHVLGASVLDDDGVAGEDAFHVLGGVVGPALPLLGQVVGDHEGHVRLAGVLRCGGPVGGENAVRGDEGHDGVDDGEGDQGGHEPTDGGAGSGGQ